MDLKKRMISLLLSLVLCGAVFVPPASSASSTVYFTSINDNLRPLTADTMPTWSGGVLYVPYTVFLAQYNGGFKLVDVDYSYIHTSTTHKLTLYTLQQMLTFDLKNGTCREEISGESYPAQAIMRNGIPYLPVVMVCNFFGLDFSYTAFSQGYLVRINNDSVVLSDAKLIDAASNLINRYLREYNQSINPAPDTTTPTSPPSEPDESNTTNVSTYLAFLCKDGQGLDQILSALDSAGNQALFFFTPEALEQEDDLVRRILGTGHSVGILADGGTLDQTRALLEEGNRALEHLAYTRTTVAYVPDGQRELLELEGWVCWDQTMALSPSGTVGPNTFAVNTLNRLEGRTRTTYLTLEGGENTARILSALLRQLRYEHFVVYTPMETRL